jgi:uncharacterized RDD family membrane protein YckC
MSEDEIKAKIFPFKLMLILMTVLVVPATIFGLALYSWGRNEQASNYEYAAIATGVGAILTILWYIYFSYKAKLGRKGEN